MVKTKVNGCCGCAAPAYPCMGSTCPNLQEYEVLICDKCKDEVDKLYIVDGDELCSDCALETFDVIE